MKTNRRLRVVLPVLVLAVVPFSLFAQATGRSEVAIHQVTRNRGARRFSVSVRVGARSIEAGLDSGSTGLRILPGVLSATDARIGSKKSTYFFGSGVRLSGVVGRARLTLGALSGTVDLQLVESVGCTQKKPHCAAAHLPLERFGLMGSGMAGAGFKAILGVSMAPAGPAGIPNPLVSMGVRRWIVELPRSADGRTGRLILNPTDAEVRAYVMFPVLGGSSPEHGAHDAIRACIVNKRTLATACGWLNMDTGAGGIQVVNSHLRHPWRSGTPAVLVFGEGRAPHLVEHLVAGERSEASRMSLKTSAKVDGVAIRAGIVPYLAFSVLYDPEHGRIGLKPRPTMRGAPSAERAASPAE